MLRTFTSRTPLVKSFVQTNARTFMSFASDQVEQAVMQSAAKNPELQQKVDQLKASPRTFHVIEGEGKFDHNKLEVQIRPKHHHQHDESIPHEIFHATHYETIRASKSQEVADMVFDASAHRPVLEMGALIFGKRMIGTMSRKSVFEHYDKYVEKGLVPDWSDAEEKLMKLPYHDIVHKEFQKL